MKYPKFLPEGGTIGFVAPSFGCNIEPYKSAFGAALETFASLGHKTVLGPNVYEGSGIGISSSPQSCGTELTDGYCDEKSDVLISCGGGELMCEILDHVDFDRVKAADPKWYMGYSDNTNFTFLLPTICDVAAIYGPCASSFGMKPWHPAVQDAYALLRGEKLSEQGYDLYEVESLKDEDHPFVPYNVTQKRDIRIFNPLSSNEAAFSGRLIGGCMDCLVNLTGTVYDHAADFTKRYEKDGIIWFLEACDLNVYAIRRAIWQMQHAGWFENVKGFLIGRPLNGQEMFGLDQYHAVTDLLAGYHVPVIMGLDIGHLPPMMPLISGSYAFVQAKGQEITVDMQLR